MSSVYKCDICGSINKVTPVVMAANGGFLPTSRLHSTTFVDMCESCLTALSAKWADLKGAHR